MKHTEHNIQTLVSDAASGNVRAFEHLYEQLYDKLYGYAWNRTFDRLATQDIVANTFIKIIGGLPKFHWNNDAAFYGWTYRLAMSEIANYFRVEQHYALYTKHLDDNSAQALADINAKTAAQELDTADDIYKLHQALAKLKKKERRIVELFYFADASHREIAAALDMREGAVRTALHRAIKKLQTAMPGATSLFDNQQRSNA